MSRNLQLVRHTLRAAGLRLHEQDVEALARWTAERSRKLALSGIEQYGQLLAEDSAAGRRERELLSVQFTTGESYFFRDQGQFDLLAATILLDPSFIAAHLELGALHAQAGDNERARRMYETARTALGKLPAQADAGLF